MLSFNFLCKDYSYRFLEFNAINLKHKEGLGRIHPRLSGYRAAKGK